ncbi:MAG: lysophospholipid acyltransferase family protein [Verrucomicrobia bacterium]|nr:lysophospholipid acyltransferase family protein [Verrucomicrobiota bacterium]
MTVVEKAAVTPIRKSGVVIPNSTKWHQRVAARMIWVLLRGLAATLRYHWQDRSGLCSTPPVGQAIYCIWHNRLSLSMAAYQEYIQPRTEARGLAALVSASRDGGMLAGVLECFGVQPVRGSSSRRGPQALLELTSWAERGYDLAITPDGPRGPRYIVQEGVMSLAQLTGLPIVPFSFCAHRKIQMKSWDRFQIPLPFSRCEMILEKPVCVPRNATSEERAALRQQLQQALADITRD